MKATLTDHDSRPQAASRAPSARLTATARGLLLAAVLHAAAAHGQAQDEKNVIDAKWRHLPQDPGELLVSDPGAWDFNFRPYGSSANLLWTDPIVQRAAASGEEVGDKRPTAINVTCNEEGFTVLVLCVEPLLKTYMATTNAYPWQSLEFFFLPGDADTWKIEHHFMFFYGNGKLNEYSWLMQDKTFRPMLPHITHAATPYKDNALVVRFTFDWAGLFDRLPFTDKRDNFWRLSMIRWNGGQTWGGVVHQQNQAGYIRWPDFTPEQKTRIMRRTLEKGWAQFNGALGNLRYGINGWSMPGIYTNRAWIAAENAAAPRSYVNFNEDPDFRATLAGLEAERKALASTLAVFGSLPPEEQWRFYRRAADMLFNFEYDVEAAYARHQANSLFKAK